MADPRTKVLEKDKRTIDTGRIWDAYDSRLTVEGKCARTPQHDDETRSTLTSISMSIELVSAHVYNHVHQKQIVGE